MTSRPYRSRCSAHAGPGAVRQSAGGHAVRSAGGVVRVEPVQSGSIELQLGVVGRRNADEHASLRTLQLVGRLSAVFQRFPGHFEQKPLLRVHARCFAR